MRQPLWRTSYGQADSDRHRHHRTGGQTDATKWRRSGKRLRANETGENDAVLGQSGPTSGAGRIILPPRASGASIKFWHEVIVRFL